MAQTTILEEQTLAGFAFDENYGAWLMNVNPAPFVLELGQKYLVAWDGVTYPVTAQDGSAMSEGTLFLGNASGYGLSGNGEPFAIGWSEYGVTYMSLTDTEATAHTLAIYQGEAVGVILKDRDGEDRAYYGVEAVKLVTTDGGTQLFSKGEAVENVRIVPDFSGGDMTVQAAQGTLVKSAVIQMPETLVPENIAEGVDIAGVVGTLTGGGGGTVIAKTGSYTATSATGVQTVTHGLGVVPDLIRIYAEEYSTSGSFAVVIGKSAALQALTGTSGQDILNYNTSGFSLSTAGAIDEPSGGLGQIYGATENVFKLGGSWVRHISGATYNWEVIAGLT